jgi:hypothetical protein
MHADDNGRPVEPSDYAALNALYAALFATVVLGARTRKGAEEPVPIRELLPMGAATFALSKVIAREKIGTWMREPFVEQQQDGARRPRGSGMRRAVGELLTCTRCVGAWSALGIVGLRAMDPPTGRFVTNVLAASAMNDWLQAAFKALTSETNALEQRAAETRPEATAQR